MHQHASPTEYPNIARLMAGRRTCPRKASPTAPHGRPFHPLSSSLWRAATAVLTQEATPPSPSANFCQHRAAASGCRCCRTSNESAHAATIRSEMIASDTLLETLCEGAAQNSGKWFGKPGKAWSSSCPSSEQLKVGSFIRPTSYAQGRAVCGQASRWPACWRSPNSDFAPARSPSARGGTAPDHNVVEQCGWLMWGMWTKIIGGRKGKTSLAFMYN